MYKNFVLKIASIIVIFLGLFSISYAEETENDIGSSEFIIETKNFTPGGNKIIGGPGGTAVDSINNGLGYIIQRLMLFIGGLALLVMTIGSGFMILHRGDDASLSKGKEIFTAGIIGLAVALLSYLMVSLLRYIIYTI